MKTLNLIEMEEVNGGRGLYIGTQHGVRAAASGEINSQCLGGFVGIVVGVLGLRLSARTGAGMITLGFAMMDENCR